MAGRIGVFVDRDGVINKEVKHPEIVDAQGRMCTDVLTPDELELHDGVQEAFSLLREAGLSSHIVSNQVGFAKGFVTKENLDAIRQRTQALVRPDGIYYCTHHEDYTGPCECKKPKKGMLLAAAADHDLDISRSYMIGDRRIDMQTGSDCKRCFLVNTREGEDVQSELAKLDPALQQKVTVVRSLKEAAQLIVAEQMLEAASSVESDAPITEAIIPCAGRGTRMGDMTNEVPKPMIAFGGKDHLITNDPDAVPFLQFIIAHLKKQGIKRFIIPVGYLGHIIEGYFGDGSDFGVEIVYAHSSVEVETGGSFKRALAYVRGERFIMHYGDAFYPYDFTPMTKRFIESGKVCMFVARNRPKVEGFADKNNLIVDEQLNITGYDKKNASGQATLLDVGISYFTREIARFCQPDTFVLDQHTIPQLAAQGKVIAYPAEHNSIGMGNVEKVDRFKQYLQEHPELLSETRALRKR